MGLLLEPGDDRAERGQLSPRFLVDAIGPTVNLGAALSPFLILLGLGDRVEGGLDVGLGRRLRNALAGPAPEQLLARAVIVLALADQLDELGLVELLEFGLSGFGFGVAARAGDFVELVRLVDIVLGVVNHDRDRVRIDASEIERLADPPAFARQDAAQDAVQAVDHLRSAGRRKLA
jgi:hypothetical protein